MRSIFPISSYRSASVNSRVYTSFVIILYKIHTEFHSRGIARRAPTAFANLPSMLCFVKTTPTITHTRPRATTYRWRRCGWYYMVLWDDKGLARPLHARMLFHARTANGITKNVCAQMSRNEEPFRDQERTLFCAGCMCVWCV